MKVAFNQGIQSYSTRVSKSQGLSINPNFKSKADPTQVAHGITDFLIEHASPRKFTPDLLTVVIGNRVPRELFQASRGAEVTAILADIKSIPSLSGRIHAAVKYIFDAASVQANK